MARPSKQWPVEVHDSIEPIEAEWRALARPNNATPFQVFGLMRLFYRQLADNKLATPVIVLVRYPDGRPAALFPLMLSRRNGLNWLRSDAQPIDYSAPIFDPMLDTGDVRAIIKAALAAVPGADLLYLNKMPGAFSGYANPIVAMPNAGRLRLSAWYMPLSGQGPEDIEVRQHKSFRHNLRRRKRNFAKKYNGAFSIAIGAEIADADIAAFRKLREQSAEEKDRHNILEEPEWAGFYKGLINGMAAPCQPWLAKLEADGEIVAMLFGFTDGKRPLAILPASKLGNWKSLAPGLLLFDECLNFFRLQGAEVLDMSLGDMAYKIRFGCEELKLYDALFPKSIFGYIYYFWWRIKVKIRERMKSIAES